MTEDMKPYNSEHGKYIVTECDEWEHSEQVTNRAAFQRDCPDATESAALHHRCIRALVRSGEIERIGREYVFKDGE